MPPESLLKPRLDLSILLNSLLNVSLPDDKSAPAQKALPDPVIIKALILS